MKHKKFFLALICLLSLSGCRQVLEKETTNKTPEPTTTQTQSTSQSESSQVTEAETTTSQDKVEQSESSQDVSTSASYNGSYYSVNGKYGEVIIVNKKHPLSSDYGYGEDPTALAAFHEVLVAMKAQGFSVSEQYSGFRSYGTQSGLYQSYVSRDGQAAADRYSARPGYSEHQTGLAFDIMDSSGALLEEPVASQWLREHAHEYGFIVRYLPGKESITGYMAESWHIRYIGAEATEIYQSGLTLEEYYNIPGGDYTE